MEEWREEMRVIGIGCIGSSSIELWGVASSCGGRAWLLYPDDDEDPQLPESVGIDGTGGLVGVRGSSGLGRGAVSGASFVTGPFMVFGASF